MVWDYDSQKDEVWEKYPYEGVGDKIIDWLFNFDRYYFSPKNFERWREGQIYKWMGMDWFVEDVSLEKQENKKEVLEKKINDSMLAESVCIIGAAIAVAPIIWTEVSYGFHTMEEYCYAVALGIAALAAMYTGAASRYARVQSCRQLEEKDEPPETTK